MDLLAQRKQVSLFDDIAAESRDAADKVVAHGGGLGVLEAKWARLRKRRFLLLAMNHIQFTALAIIWSYFPPSSAWNMARVIETYIIASGFFCIQVTALLLTTYRRRVLLDMILGFAYVGVVGTLTLYCVAHNVRLDQRTLFIVCAFVYTYPTELELGYFVWQACTFIVAIFAAASVSISGFISNGNGFGRSSSSSSSSSEPAFTTIYNISSLDSNSTNTTAETSFVLLTDMALLDRAILTSFVVLFTLLTYLPQRFLHRLQKEQQGVLQTLAAESRAQLVLLKRVIPDVFIEQLFDGSKRMTSNPIDDVTVLFCEVMMVTTDPVTGERKSKKLGHNIEQKTLTVLTAVFAILDRVVSRNGVYKVETIFSEFVAVSGLPRARQHHINTAYAMVTTAIDMLREVGWSLRSGRLATLASGMEIDLQIGINTGPVVESILGRRLLPRWKLFGDTVNTASRMKSNGLCGRIHLTAATRDRVMLHAPHIAHTALLSSPDVSTATAEDLITKLHVACLQEQTRKQAILYRQQKWLQSQQSQQHHSSMMNVNNNINNGMLGSMLFAGGSINGVTPGGASGVAPGGGGQGGGEHDHNDAETVSEADVLFGRATGFYLRPRTPMHIKGKGMMNTFLVELCATDILKERLKRVVRRILGPSALRNADLKWPLLLRNYDEAEEEEEHERLNDDGSEREERAETSGASGIKNINDAGTDIISPPRRFNPAAEATGVDDDNVGATAVTSSPSSSIVSGGSGNNTTTNASAVKALPTTVKVPSLPLSAAVAAVPSTTGPGNDDQSSKWQLRSFYDSAESSAIAAVATELVAARGYNMSFKTQRQLSSNMMSLTAPYTHNSGSRRAGGIAKNTVSSNSKRLENNTSFYVDDTAEFSDRGSDTSSSASSSRLSENDVDDDEYVDEDGNSSLVSGTAGEGQEVSPANKFTKKRHHRQQQLQQRKESEEIEKIKAESTLAKGGGEEQAHLLLEAGGDDRTNNVGPTPTTTPNDKTNETSHHHPGATSTNAAGSTSLVANSSYTAALLPYQLECPTFYPTESSALSKDSATWMSMHETTWSIVVMQCELLRRFSRRKPRRWAGDSFTYVEGMTIPDAVVSIVMQQQQQQYQQQQYPVVLPSMYHHPSPSVQYHTPAAGGGGASSPLNGNHAASTGRRIKGNDSLESSNSAVISSARNRGSVEYPSRHHHQHPTSDDDDEPVLGGGGGDEYVGNTSGGSGDGDGGAGSSGSVNNNNSEDMSSGSGGGLNRLRVIRSGSGDDIEHMQSGINDRGSGGMIGQYARPETLLADKFMALALSRATSGNTANSTGSSNSTGSGSHSTYMKPSGSFYYSTNGGGDTSGRNMMVNGGAGDLSVNTPSSSALYHQYASSTNNFVLMSSQIAGSQQSSSSSASFPPSVSANGVGGNGMTSSHASILLNNPNFVMNSRNASSGFGSGRLRVVNSFMVGKGNANGGVGGNSIAGGSAVFYDSSTAALASSSSSSSMSPVFALHAHAGNTGIDSTVPVLAAAPMGVGNGGDGNNNTATTGTSQEGFSGAVRNTSREGNTQQPGDNNQTDTRRSSNSNSSAPVAGIDKNQQKQSQLPLKSVDSFYSDISISSPAGNVTEGADATIISLATSGGEGGGGGGPSPPLHIAEVPEKRRLETLYSVAADSVGEYSPQPQQIADTRNNTNTNNNSKSNTTSNNVVTTSSNNSSSDYGNNAIMRIAADNDKNSKLGGSNPDPAAAATSGLLPLQMHSASRGYQSEPASSSTLAASPSGSRRPSTSSSGSGILASARRAIRKTMLFVNGRRNSTGYAGNEHSTTSATDKSSRASSEDSGSGSFSTYIKEGNPEVNENNDDNDDNKEGSTGGKRNKTHKSKNQRHSNASSSSSSGKTGGAIGGGSIGSFTSRARLFASSTLLNATALITGGGGGTRGAEGGLLGEDINGDDDDMNAMVAEQSAAQALLFAAVIPEKDSQKKHTHHLHNDKNIIEHGSEENSSSEKHHHHHHHHHHHKQKHSGSGRHASEQGDASNDMSPSKSFRLHTGGGSGSRSISSHDEMTESANFEEEETESFSHSSHSASLTPSNAANTIGHGKMSNSMRIFQGDSSHSTATGGSSSGRSSGSDMHHHNDGAVDNSRGNKPHLLNESLSLSLSLPPTTPMSPFDTSAISPSSGGNLVLSKAFIPAPSLSGPVAAIGGGGRGVASISTSTREFPTNSATSRSGYHGNSNSNGKGAHHGPVAGSTSNNPHPKNNNNSGNSGSSSSSSTSSSDGSSSSQGSVIALELHPWRLCFIGSQAGLEPLFVANHVTQFASGAWAALLAVAIVSVNGFPLITRYKNTTVSLAVTCINLIFTFCVFLALAFRLVPKFEASSHSSSTTTSTTSSSLASNANSNNYMNNNNKGSRKNRNWTKFLTALSTFKGRMIRRWNLFWTLGQRGRIYAYIIMGQVISVLVVLNFVLLAANDGERRLVLDWSSAWDLSDNDSMLTYPAMPWLTANNSSSTFTVSTNGGDHQFAFIIASASFVLVLMAPYYYGLLYQYYMPLTVFSLAVLIPPFVIVRPDEWIIAIAWLVGMFVITFRGVRRTELKLRTSFLEQQLVKEQQARTKRMLHAMLPESIAEQMMKREQPSTGAQSSGNSGGNNNTNNTGVVSSSSSSSSKKEANGYMSRPTTAGSAYSSSSSSAQNSPANASSTIAVFFTRLVKICFPSSATNAEILLLAARSCDFLGKVVFQYILGFRWVDLRASFVAFYLRTKVPCCSRVSSGSITDHQEGALLLQSGGNVSASSSYSSPLSNANGDAIIAVSSSISAAGGSSSSMSASHKKIKSSSRMIASTGDAIVTNEPLSPRAGILSSNSARLNGENPNQVYVSSLSSSSRVNSRINMSKRTASGAGLRSSMKMHSSSSRMVPSAPTPNTINRSLGGNINTSATTTTTAASVATVTSTMNADLANTIGTNNTSQSLPSSPAQTPTHYPSLRTISWTTRMVSELMSTIVPLSRSNRANSTILNIASTNSSGSVSISSDTNIPVNGNTGGVGNNTTSPAKVGHVSPHQNGANDTGATKTTSPSPPPSKRSVSTSRSPGSFLKQISWKRKSKSPLVASALTEGEGEGGTANSTSGTSSGGGSAENAATPGDNNASSKGNNNNNSSNETYNNNAKTYEVSLLMFDLVGFTSLSADVGPRAVVELLDSMYNSFDRIVSRRGARKIETIGDAFLVACGVPEPVDITISATIVAKCALDMLRAVESFSASAGPRLRGHRLQARIGIHVGTVLAGVIGDTMPRYQLFGAAVDEVQAMESSSEPGQVHASPQILQYLTSMVSVNIPLTPSSKNKKKQDGGVDGNGSSSSTSKRKIRNVKDCIASARDHVFVCCESPESVTEIVPRSKRIVDIPSTSSAGPENSSSSSSSSSAAAAPLSSPMKIRSPSTQVAPAPLIVTVIGESSHDAAGTNPAATNILSSPSSGPPRSVSRTTLDSQSTSGGGGGGNIGPSTTVAHIGALSTSTRASFKSSMKNRNSGGSNSSYFQRAVPDIKLVRKLEDGTGFIARDRAGGMVRGVAW